MEYKFGGDGGDKPVSTWGAVTGNIGCTLVILAFFGLIAFICWLGADAPALFK